VQGIIAQSGGELRVESALGRGTTVRLRLPLASTPDSVAAADGPRQRPCLLIVEDDAMVRDIVVRTAAGAGFRTLAVATAEHALELLEAATIDAMFADIMLGPGMDGLALARRLRGQMPELPIVLSSGYLADQLANADELRHFHFLEKPFPLAALQTALAAMLPPVARRAQRPLLP
jgi:CheY-like chemotaxis protein